MKNILTTIFLFLFMQGIAQIDVRPADTTLQRELAMAQYNQDTSAEALLLLDYGKVTIERGDYAGTFKRFYLIKQRIKILNESGFKYAQFRIHLYKVQDEKLVKIEAMTYNLEGSKIIASPLKPKEIYEEKEAGDIIVERFAMPDIKKGSVICVTYTLSSNNIAFFSWNFQNSIPVALSKLEVSLPPYFDYETISQNLDSNCKRTTKVDASINHVNTSGYQNILYSYEQYAIPAFKDETFITTIEDYRMKIGFQLAKIKSRDRTTEKTFISTWPELNDKLIENNKFGGYLKSDKRELRKIVEQFNLDSKTEAEKVKCIVNYVKTNFKWNNKYDLFAQTDMDKFMEEKLGNSANINLFLVSLLNAAKISAYPVILSTRGHGKLKANYPFVNFFNNVICYAKGNNISVLVDGTRPVLPYYSIPPECINDYGLIVEKDSTQWVTLSSDVLSKTKESMILQFTPKKDSIKGNFVLKATGYDALKYRQYWNKGYETLDSVLTHKRDNIKDSIKVINAEDPEQPFIMEFSAAFPKSLKMDGVLTPANSSQISFPPFLSEVPSSNPLTLPDRKYPVDFIYKHTYEYQSTISIPYGYEVSQKPTDLSYTMPDGGAMFFFKSIQPTDNSIQVTSTITLNNAVYLSEDYEELKKFFDVIVNKYSENIILKRE